MTAQNTLSHYGTELIAAEKSLMVQPAGPFLADTISYLLLESRLGEILRCSIKLLEWRYDTQHKDIQPNDIQHNNILHNDTQHYDTQHNDTQHNGNTVMLNIFAECHLC